MDTRTIKPALLIFSLMLLPVSFSYAETATEANLPSPLSLQKALELLDTDHPDILIANAHLESAKADHLYSESKTGLKSYLDLALARVQPSTLDKTINDNYAELVVTKTIYDFGQSTALNDSFSDIVGSRENQLKNALYKHQYEIMKRFFDVLLADFRYVVDDEEMTQRYLKYDKKRERHDLGMVSIVEVQRAETFYREALDIRAASDKNQRSTRLMLALALNRPAYLPADLSKPELSYLTDDLPETEELYKQALQSNYDILAAQRLVEAAQQKLVSERAHNKPVLSARFGLGEYVQERESRNTASAMLLLRVPIYQANESRSRVNQASAELFTRKAELKKLEQRLLVNIASLIKELGILKTKKQTAKQRLNFRDLDLEYRRALYEMEVQTNMSEKQAKLTEAQWHVDKLDYEHALLLAQLNILLGKPPYPAQSLTKDRKP